MSNFSFLQTEWPELHVEALRAERAVLADPRTACFYARRTLELAVAWLFRAESGRGGALRMPYKTDLSAFLFEPSFQQLVGPAVHTKMDAIRKLDSAAIQSLESAIRYFADATFAQVKTATHDAAHHRTQPNAPIPMQYLIDMLPTKVRRQHWGDEAAGLL